jgi:hypothetical protein
VSTKRTAAASASPASAASASPSNPPGAAAVDPNDPAPSPNPNDDPGPTLGYTQVDVAPASTDSSAPPPATDPPTDPPPSDSAVASAHPSGQFSAGIIRDGALTSVKTYDSVAGADGPNSQYELDHESDR